LCRELPAPVACIDYAYYYPVFAPVQDKAGIMGRFRIVRHVFRAAGNTRQVLADTGEFFFPP
jgi:hypothetical protein